MKKKIYTAFAIGTLLFTACNNSDNKSEHNGHDMNNMGKDTMQHATQSDTKEEKIIKPNFTSVDPKAAASIKEIVDHYLHIKNALTNDNANEAATGGKAMEAVLSKMDKSLLTAEQKKVFDGIAENLKEHAELIVNSSDKIKEQRIIFL